MNLFCDVWDSRFPVEKSAYLYDGETQYIGLKNFHYDPKKLTMIDLFCGAGGFSVGAAWAGVQPVLGIDHLIPIKIVFTCLIMSSSELYTLNIFLTMLIVIARNIYPVKIKL